MDTVTMFVSLAVGLALGVAGTWLLLRTRIQAASDNARLQAGAEISALNERLVRYEQLEREIQQLRVQCGEATKETVQLKTKLENEQKASAEKLALFEAAKSNLMDAFHSLSAEALKNNNQSFLDLAKTTLEKYQETAKGDLEKRQQSIAELVNPMRQSLQKFETQIQRIETERAGAYGELSQQVKSLGQSEAVLRSETTKLVKAL